MGSSDGEWTPGGGSGRNGPAGRSYLSRRNEAGTGYRAAISRADPTLVLFLLDRSGSMDEPYTRDLSKAEFLARTVDLALMELAVRCHKAEGTRDYFHVGCLGYGDEEVGSAFGGRLSTTGYATISAIASTPLALVSEPSGSTRPRWIEAAAQGDTPMCRAFEAACVLVAEWCAAHPRSYPPTVINVSDGEPTDGDPRAAAERLRGLGTEDGSCLVFNLHVGEGGGEVLFPDSSEGLGPHASMLFDMSSPFPPHLLERAIAAGFPAGPASRFFAWGAGASLATRFFELGTRPQRLL